MKNQKEEKRHQFTGKVINCIYNSEDFKIYAFDVDEEKFPEIKQNSYRNTSVLGQLPNLTIGNEYEIIATEYESKYGIGYKVINIKRSNVNNYYDMRIFLSEILTDNQVKVLWEHYPDIVQRVRENRVDDIDLSKLKGIKEYTFNLIKQKIIDNFCLADLVVEFQGHLSMSIIKKLYDKYSSIEVLKEKLQINPYKCLCGLAGVGFKTADSILLAIEKASNENVAKGKPSIIDFHGELVSSPERCLACLLYLLSENESEGHTKMNLANLRSECIKIVPACVKHFGDVIKSKEIYYNKETMDVSLRKTYDTEKYIADTILNNVDNKNNVWNFDTSKYRALNGFQLSDEQMKIIDLVCKNQISILNGSAGCVDCDTEYFNGTEWKRIADYQDGEKVLQYNRDGSAELVYPMNYIKRHSEYLWRFETKYGLDQCLSDNHTCYYVTSKNNLYSKSFKEVRLNQKQSGFKGKFITTFSYAGNGIDLSDDDIRLMVATFADGSFYNHNCGDGYYTQARFHIKKQRKKDRLIQLFKATNRAYKETQSATEGYTDFYVNVPFRCKHFPKEWYNCSQHQMEIIADEVLYWDSYYEEHNRFSTTSKSDADFIQFVFTSLGYRTTIAINDRTNREYFTNNKTYIRKSKEYIVSYTTRNLITMCCDNRDNHKKTEIVPYKTTDGYEYCFTVPSHILILRRNNKIFITGNCGKSSSIQAIINMLIDNHKSFKLFAPTGKSAKVISNFTHEKTSTIHRGLQYTPSDPDEITYVDDTGKTIKESTHWGLNKAHKLECDILIIDEFSMVDVFLFSKVIDALDLTKTKLLLIGDNCQLPSVGCGNLLHDFMKSNIIPSVTLTNVFRYGEGGLMRVATDVRNSQIYLNNSMKSKATVFGDNKDYVFVDLASESIPAQTVALYKKLLDKGNTIENIQVLTAKNVGDCGTAALNALLQKVANRNYGSDIKLQVGETIYYEGDLVIQKANNYKAKLDLNHLLDNMESIESNKISFDLETQMLGLKPDKEPTAFVANGESGIIKEIYNSYAVIDFSGIYVKYSKSEMTDVKLGYAITIHSSQGSSIDNVILCTPQSHIFMLNNNLLYTGLTRMRNKCYHLGTLKSVNQAIKKKANLQRNTFMQELLQEHK